MSNQKTPIGIDLGTTYSAIAYVDNEGRPVTITNSEGDLTTPSVVFFDDDSVIVGSEAEFAGESDVEKLARAAKRDMGGARYRKLIDGRYLPPEVIQSFVLNRLKSDATLKLGEFTKAVVTVPAYFNEPRRKATQDAGELAGLDVIDIINEPTAAAIAYGVQSGFLSEKGVAANKELFLVYDLGGGTFDVTLMQIDKTDYTAIGTAGDVYLGGIDWDKRLFDHVSKKITEENDVAFDDDESFKERLMQQCVRAKKSLSARTKTAVRLDYEGQRFSIDVSRKDFEEATQDLLERTRLTTDRLLRDAELKWTDLTRLLLVGGSTRMPMVVNMLEKESGLQVDRSLSPDESVAHGAAIYAGILMEHGPSAGRGISIHNVNSHDLGVLGIDPATKEPRRRIVIPRNHRLPTKAEKKFQTSKDGQNKIVVQIVEGGTDEGLGATTIGKCVVTDLPEDIKKGTIVNVSFNYLASGRLDVIAEIPSLRLSADSAIDRTAGMSRDEIQAWKKRLENEEGFLGQIPQQTKKSSDKKEAHRPAKVEVNTGKVGSDSKTKNPKTKPGKKAISPTESKSKGKVKPDSIKADKSKSKPTKSKANVEAKNKTKPDPETEDSSVFSFGDNPKPRSAGASVLDALATNEDAQPIQFEKVEDSAIFAFEEGEQKADAGESVIDFLKKNVKKEASASGTGLDDFLADLDNS